MMNEEETKTAQILVRISEEERDEWKKAAEKMNVSMSDLIAHIRMNSVLHIRGRSFVISVGSVYGDDLSVSQWGSGLLRAHLGRQKDASVGND